MEATTCAASSRVCSSPMQSQRKEWRAVSDQNSTRSLVEDGEMGRPNLEPSDERTIYENSRELIDAGFCSVSIDANLDINVLQQRILAIARQREEMNHMEVELRAQIIARSEILEIQKSFNTKIKEQENAALKLREQLHEKEQAILDMERRMEDKDRELHSIKLDNEAAWANEGLLREQSKELATFRRERDRCEAERVQHMQEIRELRELVQEKEGLLHDLQDQHRADQENMFLKDEQLKVWIARAQEMEALQSSTNHSLQVELQERTEQCNQLWLGCQRQLAEMERLHLHAMQQLQFELTDAREKSGSYSDEQQLCQAKLKDLQDFCPNSADQLDGSRCAASTVHDGALSNGNADATSSFTTTDNASLQENHVTGVPIAQSSLLGMPAYFPPGQMTTLHPLILHQQGIPQSMQAHLPQPHAGLFQPFPTISALPQWQNQQGIPEVAQLCTQNQLASSQADHNIMGLGNNFSLEMQAANGQGFHSEYPNPQISHGCLDHVPVISQVSGAVPFMVGHQSQYLEQFSSQFNGALQLNSIDHNNGTKSRSASNQEADSETQTQTSSAGASPSVHSSSLGEVPVVGATCAGLPETPLVSVGTASDAALLDERSLLAYIVRTIPPGGRIQINSTLPNRLGKMIAPLHWHDYKKKYGRLDDFVAAHPELFLIEEDYIQLREGAQEKIAATAAVAKVAAAAAAAAAAASPCSSSMPSVAVTPVSQSYRPKKMAPADSKPLNGITFGMVGGISGGKVARKLKDNKEQNGTHFGGTTRNLSSSSSTHSKGGPTHERPSSSRESGSSLNSTR